jgi:hypothetical protein
MVCIVLGDAAIDSGLEIDHGTEDALPEASSCEPGEEGLDGVESGADFVILVGGVVVEDHLNVLVRWVARSTRLRKRLSSFWRSRCMF